MTQPNYTLKFIGRGEDLEYRDSEGQLSLQRTFCDGERLYCEDTARLPFARRRIVIENLCHAFDTKSNATIFVIDEADKDRRNLEDLFVDLNSQGHQIAIEYDSAGKREKFQDEMYLSFLRAGKKLIIQGVPMSTPEDYWRWKRAAQQGLPPNDPASGRATG